jgi:GDP-mannose 6-dehydrogenase
LAKLFGANRDYIVNHIPHISRLLVDTIEQVLDHADTVVIGNNDPEFRHVPARLRPGQSLVDLVRVDSQLRSGNAYEGVCW